MATASCSTIDITEKDVIRPDQRPPLAKSLKGDYRTEAIEYTHADGAVSRGIYFSSPHSLATVLYFGGSEFRIDRESRSVIEGLSKASVDIVMFDYRGYGRSDGEPTSELLKADAASLYKFVKTKANNKVIAYGLSLGSFIAASLAQDHELDGLILEGAATNAKDLIATYVPWYAQPFVTVHIQPSLLKIDSAKAMEKYAGPLLIIGGENDSVVPVSLQKKLWKNATTKRKTMHFFPNHDHKGLVSSDDFPSVLKRFLVDEVGA